MPSCVRVAGGERRGHIVCNDIVYMYNDKFAKVCNNRYAMSLKCACARLIVLEVEVLKHTDLVL